MEHVAPPSRSQFLSKAEKTALTLGAAESAQTLAENGEYYLQTRRQTSFDVCV